MKNYLMILTLLFLAACTTPAKPQPQTSQPQPTPVGTPIGSPVSKVIGAAGGTLSSPDGKITLDIPAGAFTKDETVSIQEIQNHAQGKLSKAFRLTPEGTKFAKPVTLTFALGQAEAAGAAPESLRVAYQTAQGTWALPKSQGFDTATRRLSVQTDHFSDWSAVAGVQLVPGSATLKTGQSLTLQLAVCAVEDDPNNPLDGTIGDCSKLSLSGEAKNWSVNGVVGGNATVGTLAPDLRNGNAVYTAPAKRPAQNPVAVSVEWTHPSVGKRLMVANLTVEEDSAWQGTATYTERGTLTIPAKNGHTGSIVHTYSHTETFRVTGVVGVTGPSTRLRLEATSRILHSVSGATRGEFYSNCVTNGPVILRELYEYSIQRQLEGNNSESLEAELYAADGAYSLYLGTIGATIQGKEVVVDKLTQFCFNRVADSSYTTTHSFSQGGSGQLKLEGNLSGDGSTLSGSYTATGGEFLIPTQITVEWNLSKSR